MQGRSWVRKRYCVRFVNIELCKNIKMLKLHKAVILKRHHRTVFPSRRKRWNLSLNVKVSWIRSWFQPRSRTAVFLVPLLQYRKLIVLGEEFTNCECQKQNVKFLLPSSLSSSTGRKKILIIRYKRVYSCYSRNTLTKACLVLNIFRIYLEFLCRRDPHPRPN